MAFITVAALKLSNDIYIMLRGNPKSSYSHIQIRAEIMSHPKPTHIITHYKLHFLLLCNYPHTCAFLTFQNRNLWSILKAIFNNR